MKTAALRSTITQIGVAALVMGGLAVWSFSRGSNGIGVLYLVVGALYGAWAAFSYFGPHMDHSEAIQPGSSHPVRVYWRPGCIYCLRLRLALLRHRHRIAWINIWKDPEAAKFVASKQEGNETVPTIVTQTDRMLPRSARQIIRHLDEG